VPSTSIPFPFPLISNSSLVNSQSNLGTSDLNPRSKKLCLDICQHEETKSRLFRTQSIYVPAETVSDKLTLFVLHEAHQPYVWIGLRPYPWLCDRPMQIAHFQPQRFSREEEKGWSAHTQQKGLLHTHMSTMHAHIFVGQRSYS